MSVEKESVIKLLAREHSGGENTSQLRSSTLCEIKACHSWRDLRDHLVLSLHLQIKKLTSRKLGDFLKVIILVGDFSWLLNSWSWAPFALERVNQLSHMKLSVKTVLPKNEFKLYFWNSTSSGQERNQQQRPSPRPPEPSCDTCRQLHSLRKA